MYPIAYVGLSILREKILARYSPNIPIAKSVVPLNIAITETKNGKPGILPAKKYNQIT